MRQKLCFLCLLLGGILGVSSASAQKYAIRTNALYYAAATLNVGADMALTDHSTVGITAGLNPWVIGFDNKVQHWFVRPEYRYWVTEKYSRLFFGAHFMAGGYEVGGFKIPRIGHRVFKSLPYKYVKGYAVAVGLGVGYAFYISPRFNIELSAGAGIGYINAHTIPNTKLYLHNGFDPSSIPGRGADHKYVLPVPTELAVSFVYLFNGRNN